MDSATTGMSPFFLDNGFHPRCGYEESVQTPRTNNEIDAATFAHRMQELEEIARAEMALARADHELGANRRQ